MRWVTNVDLKAGSLPQALVSMVTKKVAGGIVSTLIREAQKISSLEAEADASGGQPAAENPYLQRAQEGARTPGSFYAHVGEVLARHWTMFGEDDEMEDGEEEEEEGA